MTTLELIFWLCTALVVYAYAGYAVILAIVAAARGREPRRQIDYPGSVSIVLCAHNEEKRVGSRILEMTEMLKVAGVPGELIVISDGSTDGTVARAQEQMGQGVQVIELAERQGKAVALSTACATAKYDILVFADCRQQWRSDALRMLLANFADAEVGAVSGDLVLEATPGVMSGVGLYWRYEKCLRRKESQIHSTVGVTGAICAVRRSLFPGVPAGTILDDVYWPLCVAMQGHRVIHETRAIAFDQLPDRASDEFRRKVRTLAGNFQLVARLPRTLLPWSNSLWLQFVSHKLMRLAVPWALLAMLATSALLPGPLYQTMFWGQIAFYVLALLGYNRGIGTQLRPAAAAASVVVLNAAAWLAFWVWISGQAGRTWSKVRYKGAA